MAKWYYYNDDNGTRRGVTGEQLIGLAKSGQITPDTIIETECGIAHPKKSATQHRK
jgi:rhamnose utilization protein RhaD (predicted bifunctional aldolase and dehydrogenase)